MNDRIERIEEKIAYLERHVTEQDKAMLELTEQIERLHREIAQLRSRATSGDETSHSAADDRPPHY